LGIRLRDGADDGLAAQAAGQAIDEKSGLQAAFALALVVEEAWLPGN
jgi:hypothetical protein